MESPDLTPGRLAPWTLLLIPALYLALSFHGIDDLGLFRDEASCPLIASRILRGGFDLPYHMSASYQGSLASYWYLPFFASIGTSVVALRAANIMMGLLILAVTYSCAKRMFGHPVAGLACLLLAVDPTFIFSMRHDWAAVGMSLLCESLALYALLRFFASPGALRFTAFCFALGICLWARANTFWFESGLLISAFIWKKDEIRALRPSAWIFGGVALLAGGAPFFLYSLSDFSILSSLPKTDIHHVQAFGYGEALLKHAQLFWRSLNGIGIQDFLLNRHAWGTLLAPLWLAAVAYGLWVGLVRKEETKPQDGTTFLPFLATTTLLSCLACVLTPPVWGVHHVVLALFPFAHILTAAVFFAAFPDAANGRSIARVCLSLQIAASLLIIGRTHALLRTDAVNPVFSRTIDSVADYVRRESPRKLVCLDWGFHDSLAFLTGFRLERSELVDKQKDRAYYWKFLTSENNLYVMYANPVDNPHSGRFFLEKIRRLGKTAVLRRTFYLRNKSDRNSLLYVYAVSPLN